MKVMERRLRQLEEPAGANPRKKICYLYLPAEAKFELDSDRCTEILQECGYFQVGQTAVLDLLHVPTDIDNARDYEQYVREHAAKICGGSGWSKPAA